MRMLAPTNPKGAKTTRREGLANESPGVGTLSDDMWMISLGWLPRMLQKMGGQQEKGGRP
jgi:hypothetical protein